MTTSDDCPIKGEAMAQFNEDFSEVEWTKADSEVHVSLEHWDEKFANYFTSKYRIDEWCPYDKSGWVHHARLIPENSDSIKVQLNEGKLITDPDEAEALGLTADAKRMRQEQLEQKIVILTASLKEFAEAMEQAASACASILNANWHQHDWVDVTEMQDERQRFVCSFVGCEVEYEGPIK